MAFSAYLIPFGSLESIPCDIQHIRFFVESLSTKADLSITNGESILEISKSGDGYSVAFMTNGSISDVLLLSGEEVDSLVVKEIIDYYLAFEKIHPKFSWVPLTPED